MFDIGFEIVCNMDVRHFKNMSPVFVPALLSVTTPTLGCSFHSPRLEQTKIHVSLISSMLQQVTMQRVETHLKVTCVQTTHQKCFLLDLSSCWCWLGSPPGLYNCCRHEYIYIVCPGMFLPYLSDMCLLVSVYFWDGFIATEFLTSWFIWKAASWI